MIHNRNNNCNNNCNKNNSSAYFEELGHRQVVEAVRTIEHDAVDGDSLGEILDCLCLACYRNQCSQ